MNFQQSSTQYICLSPSSSVIDNGECMKRISSSSCLHSVNDLTPGHLEAQLTHKYKALHFHQYFLQFMD